jgi:Protein of unknown function (DUF5674)
MQEVNKISVSELSTMAQGMYGNMVKAVVDLEGGKMIVNAEMHVDGEELLLKSGSKQKNLWGINLYPDKFNTDEFIEFDSMINIRPSQRNNSRSVEDEDTRKAIFDLVLKKVKDD